MYTSVVRVLACVMAVGLFAGTAFAVNIETVPVGNPGNAADTRYETPGYGSVGYTYNIGKHEVTAGQYTAFLNAVAATDTYALYCPYMWDPQPGYGDLGCKIQRSGSSGNYTYTVASDYANRPVNYVSWGNAARFANWLHNGQPTGAQDATTTERGAYTLDGATSDAALLAVNRNSNWKWAITSEDEWYKAAYHKNDGVTGNYWDYSTSTDSLPSNQLIDPDPGNNATYYYAYSYTIGDPYWRTEVGAHENSDSPYGTFDQGGNLWEWNEAVIGSCRGLRGGSSYDYWGFLHASARHGGLYGYPSNGYVNIGFRVSEVPEPTSLAILAFGGVGMLVRRGGLGR